MEFTDDDDDRDEHLDEDDDDGDEGITIPTPIPTAPTTIRNGAGGGSHAAPATTRYRECQKNHAVGIGGHAVDGCGEFMPAGEDGSLDALKCAACGCHRNFHRKESDAPDPGAASSSAAAAAAMHHHHPQQVFPPPYYHRTPVPPPPPPQPYLHHHMHHPHHHRPLALPASSGGRAAEEMEELSNPSSSGGGGGSGGRKKRFRTKFTAEQKERMAEFAERIGWRIQKQDEAAVEQFCREVNVTRQVLKVWLHNNKHSLAPKP